MYKIATITLSIIIFQIFIPSITLYELVIVPDVLIIFLSYIGFYYGRFYTIMMGFLLGISQDLMTQIDLMGAMAFTKSALGFCLGTLNLYINIWSGEFRLLFIFFMYLMHFFIFYFIKFNGVSISLLVFFKIIIINSILSFTLLYIIDKILFENSIRKK
jgi:cell shape-determining protein MreD